MLNKALNFIIILLLSAAVLTSPVMAMICMNGTPCPLGTYNPSRQRCESPSPGSGCPTGYTLSGSVCQANPQCGSGASYNQNRKRCEEAASSYPCPPNYTWDSGKGLCTTSPQCPAGSFNNSTQRCEQSDSTNYTCSLSGSSYGTSSDCASACTGAGTCSASGPYYCSDAAGYCNFGIMYSRYGNYCPGDVSLNSDSPYDCTYYSIQLDSYVTYHGTLYSYYYYTCSLTGSTYGYSSDCNSSCSQSGTCSGPTYSCPTNWTLSGSICYQSATCPSGGSYNSTYGLCTANGTTMCNSGYTYDSINNVCYQAATCTNSGSLNTTDNMCEISGTSQCPTGMTYDSANNVCYTSINAILLTCIGNPPVCPQGQVACSSSAYSVSGNASVTSTNVPNKNGLKRFETTRSGYINFFGWACTVSGCKETAAGSLTVTGGDVSGSVSTNQITSVNGNGENMDFYNDSTLVGSITISGSIITGSASASNGFLSVHASGAILTFTGINSAGTINIAGTSSSCPLGSQYPCGNTGSGYFCSNIPCIDDTVGGQFSPSAQVCAKDLNGDGTIEPNEFQQCTLVSGGMFCPIDAVNCSNSYKCSSGTYNTSSQRCELTGTAQCPNGMTYDSADNLCYSAATVIYTCPYGSQYTCLPNPSTGNLQCSDLSCFTIASKPTQQSKADTTSYQNDGKVDPATGKCLGQIYIFNGKPSQCRPPGISTLYFNCCDTNPGSFWFIQNRCGTQEATTVKKVGKKQCHYIGDYCQEDWWLVGCVQRADVYCCFGSELGRIIQEQGRPQLISFNATGWGTPEQPNCRGFTPEEFQHLDFSKIDLSEFISDMTVASQATIQNKMKTGFQDFFNNLNK